MLRRGYFGRIKDQLIRLNALLLAVAVNDAGLPHGINRGGLSLIKEGLAWQRKAAFLKSYRSGSEHLLN